MILSASASSGAPLDVLHVLWQGAGGGAERHVLDLADGLSRRGIRTGVLYLKDDDGVAPELARLGVVHRSCRLAAGGDPRGPLRVAAALRELHPRLLHDHVSTPWLRALLPMSTKRSIVATEHGHMLRPVFAHEGPRLWIERVGARRTDLYLAPSRAIADAVRAHYHYPAERIRVIPHGIRSAVEGVPRGTREDVHRELSIDDADRVVLFVGRLDETKGILDLWEAFTGIASADPGAGRILLLVAGAGELAGELSRRVAQSGLADRVRILGFRHDVGRLLAAADIFVLPARHEAFGIVLLEAMSAGVAIVATRTGGIPEIVSDGETGLLAEPGDPPGLGRLLLELAGDPEKRQALGRAGLDRWARSFTLDRSVDETLEAYRWTWNRRG